MNVVTRVVTGVLPVEVLSSGWFEVLATFVAVNTLLFAALSVVKLLPVTGAGVDPGRPALR